jgi:hypothetical protein
VRPRLSSAAMRSAASLVPSASSRSSGSRVKRPWPWTVIMVVLLCPACVGAWWTCGARLRRRSGARSPAGQGQWPRTRSADGAAWGRRTSAPAKSHPRLRGEPQGDMPMSRRSPRRFHSRRIAPEPARDQVGDARRASGGAAVRRWVERSSRAGRGPPRNWAAGAGFIGGFRSARRWSRVGCRADSGAGRGGRRSRRGCGPCARP